jgi:hypothetical protein
MAKRESDPKDGSKSSGGGRARFLAWLALAVGIFYITMAIALSLSVTREAVASRLELAFGTPVAIGKSRLGLPLSLVLVNVATEGLAPGKAGFAAREVRVTPVGIGRWNVRVRRGSLVLVRGGGGAWEPTAFSRLGELPTRSLDDVSVMTAPFRQSVALDVRDCSVRWLEADGREVASVLGVAFAVTPVKMPGRVLYHHSLSIQRASAPGGVTAQDAECEWLSGDGILYRGLPRRSVGGGVSASGAFWQGKDS